MAHIVKKAPPTKSLAALFVTVILLILIIAAQSCSAEKKLKRQEEKALKPYVAVLTDIDPTFQKGKEELLARIVDAKIPNKAKKETVIKYLPGVVVKDTSANKKLRLDFANSLQGKKCFTPTEMDSIIDYFIENIEPIKITDTINNSTTETIIDTTGNKRKNDAYNSLTKQLQDSTFQLLVLREKREKLIASNSQLKSDKQYWEIRFFILLFSVIAYAGLRVYLRFKP